MTNVRAQIGILEYDFADAQRHASPRPTQETWHRRGGDDNRNSRINHSHRLACTHLNSPISGLPAEKDRPLIHWNREALRTFSDNVRHPVLGNKESYGSQSIGKIGAVNANMIVLAEASLPLLRIRDSWILIGL